VKSDDAEAIYTLWDNRIWALHLHTRDTYFTFKRYLQAKGILEDKSPLDVLRSAFLCYWWKRVARCLRRYLRETFGEHFYANEAGAIKCDIGRDCIERACNADWWEWRAGSTLFFWRWPKYARCLARDGHPVWITKNLPTDKKPQHSCAGGEVYKQVQAKLQNMREGQGLCQTWESVQSH
jgi:hypothetical protein